MSSWKLGCLSLIFSPFIFIITFFVFLMGTDEINLYFGSIAIVISIIGGVFGLLAFLYNVGLPLYQKVILVIGFVASIVATFLGVNRYLAKKKKEQFGKDWKGKINP